MAISTLSERFVELMWPRVRAFHAEVGMLETSGIPEPHLPHWGKMYESALPKIGVIGRDTRGWGGMPQFLEAASQGPNAALFRGKTEFDSLAFTNWTNNFGKTFWDTSMKFIAEMHGVSDWKSLKRREIVEPLQSFFWANVNSVEQYDVSPKMNGVQWDTWSKVKMASEKYLDSLRTILDIFRPDLLFVMNWHPGVHFLDLQLEWNDFGEHQSEAVDPETGCVILATTHPTWLNNNNLYDEAVSGLIQKANKVLNSSSRVK